MLSKKGRQGLGAMKAICPTEPQTGTSVPHRLAALARACNSAMAALCSCRDLNPKEGSRGTMMRSTPPWWMWAISNRGNWSVSLCGDFLPHRGFAVVARRCRETCVASLAPPSTLDRQHVGASGLCPGSTLCYANVNSLAAGLSRNVQEVRRGSAADPARMAPPDTACRPSALSREYGYTGRSRSGPPR